jgi:hypothetical protein
MRKVATPCDVALHAEAPERWLGGFVSCGPEGRTRQRPTLAGAEDRTRRG